MSGIKGTRYIDENGVEVFTGGLKAARTNLERHGKDFYKGIGKKGGQAVTSKPKGFAANRELAKEAGKLGGRRSKRGYKLIDGNYMKVL